MDEMTIDELRAHRNFTQAQISQALGITQAAVSKLEFRNDPQLSSIRKYVEALGAALELRAVFPDESVKLRGLGEDEILSLLRGMNRQHCKLHPEPVDCDGRPVPNRFDVVGLDDDERYLCLHKTGTYYQVQIPVRRTLEVRPAPPHEDEATLSLDGFVRVGPGPNCQFVEN
jgi:transcriptional regulator with XRE-family HTH domain